MQLPSQLRRFRIRGFTLVELLIVIAIISILAALLFPAGQSALNSAKKTTAKNQVVQIATAISAYETEYGRLPAFSSTSIDAAAVAMLCTAGDTVNNPRGIIFLEATPWKPGKGGTNAVGFCDPFSSNTAYSVSLDTNYSNVQSNVVLGGVFGTTNTTKHVMVWSTPNVGRVNVLINSWD